MENNKLNLVTAFLNLMASICYIIVATAQNKTVSKGLFIIASIFLLISSIGFFCTYAKNKRNADQNGG